MSDALLELVDRLAAISLVDVADDLELLEQAMLERQELLDAIQNADGSALSSALRESMNARLEEVLAHDSELVRYLQERRDDVQKALEKLSSGRAAVRGYGGTLQSEPPPSRRFG